VTPGRRLRRQGWQPRTLVWGASGILLLVSALVTWVPERDRRSSRPRVPFEPSSTLSLSPDSKETREAPPSDLAVWPPFRSAREAEGWSFDLFTAPTLFAGASGGGWSATRPEGIETDRTEPGAPEADVPVPLRVVEIVQDLFPVQLAGFGRSPRGSFGVFHLVATREVVVAREGDRLGRLPWRVTSLDQGRRRSDSKLLAHDPPESPHATVIDEQTGERTQLVAGERLNRGDPWAMLEISGQNETHALQAGGRVTTPAGDFVLTSIDLETRCVVVSPVQRDTHPASDPLEFVCTLRFRAADAGSGPLESETLSTSLR
jgi:hypothetical protein